jgi:hypothetical protein
MLEFKLNKELDIHMIFSFLRISKKAGVNFSAGITSMHQAFNPDNSKEEIANYVNSIYENDLARL